MWGRWPGGVSCYNKVPVKPLNHDCGAKCIDVHISPTFLGWISKKRRKKGKGFIQEIGGAHQNHKVSKFTALQKDWEKKMRWLVSKMFQILTVFVMFIPIWGNDPVWCFAYVSNGLVQPATKKIQAPFQLSLPRSRRFLGRCPREIRLDTISKMCLGRFIDVLDLQ